MNKKVNIEELDKIIYLTDNKNDVKEIGIDKDDFDKLLKIKDNYIKRNISQILKNNLKYLSNCVDSEYKYFLSSKMSNLIINVFSELISNNLFSIQVPDYMIFDSKLMRTVKDDENNIHYAHITKKIDIGIRKMNIKNIKNIYDINWESLINRYRNLIDEEIINYAIELGKKNKNNELSINNKNFYSILMENINYTSKTVIGKKANNIIVTQNVVEFLVDSNKIEEITSLYCLIINDKYTKNNYGYLGTIEDNSVDIFVDLHYKEKKDEIGYILSVYKGIGYDAGIAYHPYYPFIGKSIDNEDNRPCYSFNMRDSIVDVVGSEDYFNYVSIVR